MVYEFLLPLAAGITAGIGWSTIGIWSKWRSGLKEKVDYLKLRKNALVGAGTGLITYVYAESQNAAPIITDIGSFGAAVIGYFTLVIVVDKLLTKHSEAKSS